MAWQCVRARSLAAARLTIIIGEWRRMRRGNHCVLGLILGRVEVSYVENTIFLTKYQPKIDKEIQNTSFKTKL